MSQKLKLRIAGLYTNPNPLSEVPEGSLEVADNIVIDRESVAETRRGLRQYGAPQASASKLFQYRGTVLLHDDASLFSDSGGGTWANTGGALVAPCPPIKVHSAEQNRNLFLTSSVGIRKLDSPTAALAAAGAPRALDLDAAIGATPGFLDNGNQVAYRVLWSTVDANGNLIAGAPSARAVVENTSGVSRQVDLTFTIPSGIDTSYKYEVYRSPQGTTSPSDELQLVTSALVTGAQITAGVVTFTDDVADDERGAIIYTAPTQEGILQSNFPPPVSCDLTSFQQFMFYSNIKNLAGGTITLKAQPSIADTITIGGTVYTAAAAEDILADEFDVSGSLEDSIDSLIRVINRSTTDTTINAYKINANSFELRSNDVSVTSIAVVSSSTAVLDAETLEEEEFINRVAISKLGQPEAVPLLNFVDVGSADQPIQRILDIRDAVIVLKDDGIFRITGTTTDNFVVEQLDSTIEIRGPETAVELGNQVFMMSDQGVVAVTVNTVTIVSRQIERDLLEISQLSNFNDNAWALSYDSDRKYVLGLPSTDGDTNVTQLFVYNWFTASWTRWPIEMIAGIVNEFDDLIYMIRSDDQVVQERKSYTRFDSADDEFDVTITASGGNTVSVSAVPAGVAVGQTLLQGSNESLIVDIVGLDLIVNDTNLPWVAGAATTNVAIPVVLQWTEETAGNPGILKHYGEITYMFQDARFLEILAGFSSNFRNGFDLVTLTAIAQAVWGLFGWGSAPWGGGPGGFQPIRTYFPRETCRAYWVNLRLELEEAFNSFSLTGASLRVNANRDKVK